MAPRVTVWTKMTTSTRAVVGVMGTVMAVTDTAMVQAVDMDTTVAEDTGTAMTTADMDTATVQVVTVIAMITVAAAVITAATTSTST